MESMKFISDSDLSATVPRHLDLTNSSNNSATVARHLDSVNSSHNSPSTSANHQRPAEWSAIDHSKIHSLSPIGSDSEEESGYVSCASSDQKPRERQDIDKLFADVAEIIGSPVTSDSINDLSAGDQSDFFDLNKSLTQMEERSLEEEFDETDQKSGQCDITRDSEQNQETGNPDKVENNYSSEEKLNANVKDYDSVDIEENEVKISSSVLINCNNSQKQTTNSHDSNEQTTNCSNPSDQTTFNKESSSEEEDEDEEPEEVIEEEEIEEEEEEEDEEEDDDDDDDENTLEHGTSPNVPYFRERSGETESEETWISGEENCDYAHKDDKKSNCSEIPDLQDFFDGLGDGVSYLCHDDQTDDDVVTYQSPEFYHRERSVHWEAAQSSDSEDDYNYIFKSNLNTGKCYAFPRRDPRTITEAVEFWETDFEVKGAIYPRMSVWESKGLAPTHQEDAEDYDTFNMYKSLYDKWVKCNKNRDQWLQKYWGKSIETISKMKGPAKRKLPAPTLECVTAMDTEEAPPSDDSTNQTIIAERRRRRRYNAMFSQ